jgi:hypothetical protein
MILSKGQKSCLLDTKVDTLPNFSHSAGKTLKQIIKMNGREWKEGRKEGWKEGTTHNKGLKVYACKNNIKKP